MHTHRNTIPVAKSNGQTHIQIKHKNSGINNVVFYNVHFTENYNEYIHLWICIEKVKFIICSFLGTHSIMTLTINHAVSLY